MKLLGGYLPGFEQNNSLQGGLKNVDINVPVSGVDQSTQFALDQTNKVADRISQGLSTTAKLGQQGTDILAQGENIAALPNSVPKSGETPDLIGSITKIITGVIDARNKQEAEQQSRDANKEAEELSVIGEGLLRSPEGFNGYQRKVEDLLAKYPRLSTEQFMSITNKLYAPASTVAAEQSKRQVSEMQQMRDAVVEQKVSELQLKTSNQVALLAETSDPVKRQGILDTVTKDLNESLTTADLNPRETIIASNKLLQTLAQSNSKGSAEWAQMVDQVSNLRAYNTDRINLLEQYNQGKLSKADYQVSLQELQVTYKVTGIGNTDDPDQVRKNALAAQQLILDTQDQMEKGDLSRLRGLEINDAQAASLVSSLIKPDGSLDQVKLEQMKSEAVRIPGLRGVISIAEARAKLPEQQTKFKLDMLELRTSKDRILQGSLEKNLSWLSGNVDKMVQLGLSGTTVDTLRALIKENSGDPAVVAENQKKWQAIQQELVRGLDQRIQLKNEEWSRVQDNAGRRLQPYLDMSPEARSSIIKTFIDSTKTLKQSEVRGTTPNFNPPQLYQHKVGGSVAVLPFKADANVPKVYDHSFKEQRSGRLHAGVDIAVSTGTPIIMPTSGKVVTVQTDPGVGYGTFVTVQMSDGRFARYAHLDSTSVKVGDNVKAGQEIAKSGSSGTRDGAQHLHWEIRTKNNYGSDDTLNPLTYGFQSGGRNARSDTTAVTIPKDAVRLSANAYILNGKLIQDGVSSDAKYSVRNPVVKKYASANLKDYSPNTALANYGYKALAEDPSFAKALAKTSSNIGVPAQWLADLMAFETGGSFATHVDNGQGYTGLIQFGDDAASDLGTSRGALAQMTPAEQMKYVERYLAPMKSQIKTPADLVMAVWGGAGNLAKLKRDPQAVKHMSDGNTTFSKYLDGLGKHAGRHYDHYYRAQNPPTIHTTYHADCPFCQNLVKSNSPIIPHESH